MSFPLISLAASLTEFIPSLAKWLGGDQAEDIANKTVSIAKNLTGFDDGTSILKVLKERPDILIEFQKAFLSLERDLLMQDVQEKQSARARDIALAQSGRRNVRADVMVVTAALGLAGCLGMLALCRENLPGEAVGIISTIAGLFGSCLRDAYGFEFGSSRGSREKDERVTAFLSKI